MTSYPTLSLYIDGAWAAGGGSHRSVVDPATENQIGELPLAASADLDRALAAAERGSVVWRATPAIERFRIMRRAADLMRERAKAIGEILTLEQGKPLAEAVREVSLSGDIIEFLAEEGKRAYGRIVPARTADILAQNVMKVPVGPVAAFTPWNFPANQPSRKLGGALAAGCSVILKPAEETPGTAVEIVRCFEEAGLPKGVLNLVFGAPPEVSRHLISSPVIRKVAFTGSTAVGRELGALAGRYIKRYTPELGGHAPVIVLADADIDRAVRLSVAAKFRNAGQICTAPTRFLVEAPVMARFAEGFVAAAKALKLGHGLDATTQMGPLAHERRVAHMESHVSDAEAKGARLLLGGRRTANKGYFYEANVISDAPLDARVQND
jgi:succinate-semialdehyde dehydrogenase/glutarate-semialdehyde dehydrogenase